MTEAARLTVKSIVTNFLSFAFYMFFGILYMTLLYKYAPTGVVSEYFLLLSVITIAGLALSSVITYSCNYQLPEVYAKSRKEGAMLMLLSMLLSGIAAAIVFIAILALNLFSIGMADSATLVLYALVYTAFSGTQGFLTNLLWIKEKLVITSIFPIFRVAAIAALVLLHGTLSGSDVMLFLWALTAYNILVGIYVFWKTGLDFSCANAAIKHLRNGLSNGLWFYIDSLGGTLLNSIDNFMLGAFSLKGQIAGYNAALGPSKYVQIAIPGNLGSAIFPVLRSGRFKESNGAIAESGIKWSILLFYPITIAAFLFPENIIAVLSPGYTSWALFARIFILGFFLTPISTTIRQIMISMGRAKVVALTTLSASIITIALNLLLFFGFHMGTLGIAISLALSNFACDFTIIAISGILPLKKIAMDILRLIALPTLLMVPVMLYVGGLLDLPIQISILKSFLEFGVITGISYAVALPFIWSSITSAEKQLAMSMLKPVLSKAREIVQL
jgi:O-antigen/teichoic acid export membrane protein